MKILEEIAKHAQQHPDRIAVISGEKSLTWQQLWIYSDRLAGWLAEHTKPEVPIAVYGHKHPWMIACFLACVKSGHSYCPIDVSVPDARMKMILDALPSDLMLAAEPLLEKESCTGENEKKIVGLSGLEDIFQDKSLAAPDREQWVSGSGIYYIIFTSGSTGTPKGVQITADCLGNYLDWSVGLGTTKERKQGQVFLNQAPFSFDLSVMDLYTCLASGGTLFCLEKQIQSDYALLMQALEKSGANVWVSTPSFADVCLSDKKFCRELLPGLEVFLFCGETLGTRTARKLQERFPNAVVMNTYGPTESTVAVTDVQITPEMAASLEALPVGRPKPGTRIMICAGEKEVQEGEKGEILIIGDTVSTGYYRQPGLTEKAFFTEKETGQRAYHTGDEGYVKDGMLYYCGRIDLQIKLHGYRVELEDIENNLRRLPEIAHVVVVPNSRGGKVSSLTACTVLAADPVIPEDAKAMERQLRERLADFLPSYMIPKKFVFLEKIPMTNNGKADRKLLGGQK